MGNFGKSFALLIVALFLTSLVILPTINVKAQSTTIASEPAIEWQQNYVHTGYYANTGVESVSNIIQTSDGGYAFMDLGWSYQFTFVPSTIFKVDSSGNIQWKKTINFLEATTIIQTSDEGYEISGRWSTYGTTYESIPTLIKTDSQGTIQWVENYSSVPNLGIDFTSIQTSDGGFVNWSYGSIIKTDSKNDYQWFKNITYSNNDTPYPYPLAITSVIETSDGALSMLGVGQNLLDNPRTGKIYLLKTEAFLSLPSPLHLPTPIPTPVKTVSKSVFTPVIIAITSIAVVALVSIVLVFYLKHRKR